MKYLLVILIALLPTLAHAELREVTMRPADMRNMQSALSSLSVRPRIIKDGASEKLVGEPIDLKPGISYLIARNLNMIKEALAILDAHKRSLVGEILPAPDSPEERQMNWKLSGAELEPITIKLETLREKELRDAKVNMPPLNEAALDVILVKEGDGGNPLTIR